MYATVRTDAKLTENPPAGCRAHYVLDPVDGGTRYELTVWDETPADDPLPEDGYTVVGWLPGPAATEPATVVSRIWFDGPRTAEQDRAAEFAGRNRIKPAIADVAGLVRTLVLRGPDNALMSFAMCTTPDAIEEISRRVMSTSLLPGEDAALLSRPDGFAMYRVAREALAAVADIGGF